MAISGFGLTTRGVTYLAISDDPDQTRYQLFLLNLSFAIILIPFIAVLLTVQGASTELTLLLIVYTVVVPSQLDWADHGRNNFRRPLLKNAMGRIASLVLLAVLLVGGVTLPVLLSAALLLPQIAVNLAVYRSWLGFALSRRGKNAKLRTGLSLLFWPGIQRVASSTYANLDVILVPVYFPDAIGASLLYVYRIFKALLGVMLGGVTSLLPRLARQAAGMSSEAAVPLATLFICLLSVSTALTTTMLWFDHGVLQMLGADKMANAFPVYRTLVFAIVPMALNNFVVNMLLYPRQQEAYVLGTNLLVSAGVVVTFGFCKTPQVAAQLFLIAEYCLLSINCLVAWRCR